MKLKISADSGEEDFPWLLRKTETKEEKRERMPFQIYLKLIIEQFISEIRSQLSSLISGSRQLVLVCRVIEFLNSEAANIEREDGF